MKLTEEQIKKCPFDKKGFCHALACYSPQKCGARDKKGNPKYYVGQSGK